MISDQASPRPLILISPHTETEGTELPDEAISLSHRYADAVYFAGGLPFVLPCTTDQAVVREAVSRCAGVLLTGGEDIRPELYSPSLPPEVRDTVVRAVGNRDLYELILIDETLRQSRPLLGICRGHQMINVALGGDLVADIPLQRPGSVAHNRQAERFQPVHEVEILPGSLLARITGASALPVNSTHHQAADRLAPPLRATARSADGIVEALELDPEGRAAVPFFLTVQFHPERLYDRYPAHARLFEAFIEACRVDRALALRAGAQSQ